jgi:endo-1,4-beta-mannosidase
MVKTGRTPARLILLGVVAALALAGAAADHPPGRPRVTACGTELCLSGRPWPIALGTVYGGLVDPAAAVGRVRALGLNAVRVTDYLDVRGDPRTAPFAEAAWSRVDRLLAAASDAGLYVVLDLSTYRNLLRAGGANPYTVDWRPFLEFVASRVNTVNGIRYADDPTIAVVSFAGEVDGVNGGDNTYGLTTATLTNFYRTVEDRWHRLAPGPLLTAGGLSHLDWDSGIDWRAIFALPHNDFAALHVYTQGDRESAVPAVSRFSQAIGRPWIIEEFGFPADLPDVERARRYADTYALAARYGAAGTGLWNVGAQTRDTYDVGPQFPLTSAVVRRHASDPR